VYNQEFFTEREGTAVFMSGVVEVQPVSAKGTLPPTHGEFQQGALFRALKRVSPQTANRLHGSSAYTVSQLHRNDEDPNGTRWFRVTCLDAACVPCLGDMLQGLRRWELRGVDFRCGFDVRAIHLDPGSHEWAAVVTPEELVGRAVLADRENPGRFVMEFLSPACFDLGQVAKPRWQNWPSPDRLLRGLERRWLRLFPDRLPAEGWDWELLNNLYFGAYNLRSHNPFFPKRNSGASGCTGFVEYVWNDPDVIPEGARQWCQFLTLFAFYCGAGDQTAWGMGQCRRIPTARNFL
jgi:hypothetical protein